MHPSMPSNPGAELLPPSEAGLTPNFSPRTLSPTQVSARLTTNAPYPPSPSFERRVSSASPARKPLRSSPLAGPALSPQQQRSARTKSTPDLTSIYTRFLPRNNSYHDIPPATLALPSPSVHAHSYASSSKIPQDDPLAVRKKLTKRFSSQASRRSSAIPPPSIPDLPPSPPPPTTRIGNVEGVDKISTFTASEAPRFTRTALKTRNVVMPLSVKEYQRKRRDTVTDISSLVARSPQSLMLPPESRRRGRSFTQEESEAFGRYQRALAGREPDFRDDALPSPPRIPSPTQSFSTDSTMDLTPFASSMSSTSSLPTISEPYSLPQSPCFSPYSATLVGHKSTPDIPQPSRSPSTISFRHFLRPHNRSDDGCSSAWSHSGEGSSRDGSTTCEGSVQSTSRSQKGKAVRSPFKRLLRTFTLKRRQTTI